MSDRDSQAPRQGEVGSIDPSTLPQHYEVAEKEAHWDEVWQADGVYHYDPSRPREETFVVDTPPPTVSGALHIGHVFSYTQADIVARYRRMKGLNVFYPMGWDDNGLPTERRVQNYFHVRCDPNTPYEEGLDLPEANAKTRKGRPRLVSRPNFIELCHKLTLEDERAYKELWRRAGLSVDWREEYTTIEDHSRRTAQFSFVDLHQKGLVYTNYAPTMWDVDFHTAVAQAEAEDRSVPGAFHHIEFGLQGGDGAFTIATTRPELLPACVGVTAHPDDERYAPYFGKHAVTPLFHAPVPIFPSELADPEKGTGVLMVCTFGDQTDVTWWREQGLPMRRVLDYNGRLRPVRFGDGEADEFVSLRPDEANARYAELEGKNVKQAHKAIVEMLRDPGASATGSGAPLVSDPETMDHSVKFYEKGERPLEILPTRQWFARLMDKKEELLAFGEKVQWHPEFMHARYRDWTENLGLDWCLSRQRFFGVPIPVWYRLDADGNRDYDDPIVADVDQLPVDPTTDVPRGFEESQRGNPGGFDGEADIFDTWFTSSLTPQINSHWVEDADRHRRLFPADIRPQSHEIIRTWAFYTIAKAMLHENSIPWEHVLVSGWILDPDRKKMSKSKGNVTTPADMLDRFGADAVRYWAAGARFGVDTALDEKVFKVGKRLITKIFNASKFVLSQTGNPHPITAELDRAFVAKLRALVAACTEHQEEFRYSHAMAETERFFWSQLTDTYLELSKVRARAFADGATGDAEAESGSAVAALRLGLNVLLRLFAPALPHITEEVWSWRFAEESGQPSIHRAPWPTEAELAGVAAPESEASFDVAVAAQQAINKAKADAQVSMGREVASLVLAGNAAMMEALARVLPDVLAATRCQSHELVEDASVEDGVIEVRGAEFPERVPA